MGIFVYFPWKLFSTGLLQYFIHFGLTFWIRELKIVGSETVVQRICLITSWELFLRDFVT